MECDRGLMLVFAQAGSAMVFHGNPANPAANSPLDFTVYIYLLIFHNGRLWHMAGIFFIFSNNYCCVFCFQISPSILNLI